MSAPLELNEESSEIYDRQIRVWGVECQKKLSASLMHLVGVDAVNFELGKNCVLSGMNIVLEDLKAVTRDDLVTNIFITAEDIGRMRDEVTQQALQEINTLVEVKVQREITKANVLCCSSSIQTALEINKICREKAIPSYYVFKAFKSVFVISDLLNEKSKPLQETINSIPNMLKTQKNRHFSKFYSFLAVLYCAATETETLPECFIDSGDYEAECSEIKTNLGRDFHPSACVIAGIISQDIIKLLTSSHSNIEALIFDGDKSIAYTDSILASLPTVNK